MKFKTFYSGSLDESKKLKFTKQDFERHGLKGVDYLNKENQKKFQFMIDKANEMGLEHIMNKTWREKDKGKHAKSYQFSWSHSAFA